MGWVVLHRTQGNAYIPCPCVIRASVQIEMLREHSSNEDVFSHEVSDVIICAHESAVRVQAKPRAELQEDRKNLNVRLEICNGKDDLLGDEVLSEYSERKSA